MDHIDFVVEDEEVTILINGTNLIEMLRDFERPFAQAEGSPSIAGGYSGLPQDVALLPSKQFLGEHKPLYGAFDKTYLLVCQCGEPGCWPFEAKITLTETEVVWDEFAQPYRRSKSQSSVWNYEAFGPFRFDRTEYERALQSSIAQ